MLDILQQEFFVIPMLVMAVVIIWQHKRMIKLDLIAREQKAQVEFMKTLFLTIRQYPKEEIAKIATKEPAKERSEEGKCDPSDLPTATARYKS